MMTIRVKRRVGIVTPMVVKRPRVVKRELMMKKRGNLKSRMRKVRQRRVMKFQLFHHQPSPPRRRKKRCRSGRRTFAEVEG